jgi:hypothetical protein
MAKELSGFPSLKPAIITKVNIGDVNPLGKSSNVLLPTLAQRVRPNITDRHHPQRLEAYTLRRLGHQSLSIRGIDNLLGNTYRDHRVSTGV